MMTRMEKREAIRRASEDLRFNTGVPFRGRAAERADLVAGASGRRVTRRCRGDAPHPAETQSTVGAAPAGEEPVRRARPADVGCAAVRRSTTPEPDTPAPGGVRRRRTPRRADPGTLNPVPRTSRAMIASTLTPAHPRRRIRSARSAASQYPPMSQGQTVPLWYAASRCMRSPSNRRHVAGIIRRQCAHPHRRQQVFSRAHVDDLFHHSRVSPASGANGSDTAKSWLGRSLPSGDSSR